MTRNLPKYFLGGVVVLIIALVVYAAVFTSRGSELLHHPRHFHAEATAFATDHPIGTPLLIVGLYVALTISGMPVWWVQVLAGMSLGLVQGLIWCGIAGVVAGTVTFWVSRTIMGDFFHKRIESKLAKLHKLDEQLSHNGLLVVMMARLVHVVPFGISFYMFGLLKITTADVAIGTLLGYLPATLIFVRTGAGARGLLEPRFVLLFVLLHVLLLTPLVLRYLHPQAFRKVGIE
jgi:uncharacterized membrane protein YdjX (TVP38/TMEM64 family)